MEKLLVSLDYFFLKELFHQLPIFFLSNSPFYKLKNKREISINNYMYSKSTYCSIVIAEIANYLLNFGHEIDFYFTIIIDAS